MNEIYINYDAFELICWDIDGDNGNVSISLSKEQAKKICDIIGLVGFSYENDKPVSFYKRRCNKCTQ